ncbi:MAG: hypothetical protein ACI9G9_001399, partial [Psychromonas sp.]
MKHLALYARSLTRQNIVSMIDFLRIVESMGWKVILEVELKEQLIKKAGIGS